MGQIICNVLRDKLYLHGDRISRFPFVVKRKNKIHQKSFLEVCRIVVFIYFKPDHWHIALIDLDQNETVHNATQLCGGF